MGRLTLRNRLVMGSMHVGTEDVVEAAPAFAAYLAERARGGVGLIVTGGISPSPEGLLSPTSRVFDDELARAHRMVTDAVHREGGAVILQLLHAGRYANTPAAVSASASQSPISPFPAREMSDDEVRRTITDFARAATLACDAGYDGVEIMGSEGYLLNQFLAPRTNQRTDDWGGDATRRRAFPLAVTRAVREALGAEPLLTYRISLADLVDEGQTWEEIEALAAELVEEGVDALSTGIGWHEARVPTIVTSVPRAAFVPETARLRQAVAQLAQPVPVIASNRLHDPQVAESVLAEGSADFISMARPLLADAHLPRKCEAIARGSTDASDVVVPCISCNQACLDRVFSGKPAGCLMNPRAGKEHALPWPVMASSATTAADAPAAPRPTVLVVGGGVAGMEAAASAAELGLEVTLQEQSAELGGQFRYAAAIPGKEEYAVALRAWEDRLSLGGVTVMREHTTTTSDLASFDHVIIATGVVPRSIPLPVLDARMASDPSMPALPQVIDYASWCEALTRGTRITAQHVAIIGAGGIGVDIAVALTASDPHLSQKPRAWREHWGILDAQASDDVRGGLRQSVAEPPLPSSVPSAGSPHGAPIPQTVHLLQRKSSRIGATLGKTTGWVHRAELSRARVQEHTGVTYEGIERGGLRITKDGQSQLILAELVIICAGQESVHHLATGEHSSCQVIGGARLAGELDAERAVSEGRQAALSLAATLGTFHA